jgi:Ca-activated chloride channel family protein
MSAFEVFHLLRPWALIGLVPLFVVWLILRRPFARRRMPIGPIAPHLAQALSVSHKHLWRLHPIDLSSMILAFLIMGASGPTWSIIPSPLAAQSAPLVIVLQVTPSMEQADIAPNRLERAKQKITDLTILRSGARTALVAFSGSAHVVLPMTEDAGILRPYLEGLSPDIMPQEGFNIARAEAVAIDILGRERTGRERTGHKKTGPEETGQDKNGQDKNGHDKNGHDKTHGGILYVIDALSAAEAASLSQTDNSLFLFISPNTATTPAGTGKQIVTADDHDIRAIQRQLAAAHQRALAEEGTQPWQDRGKWFAIPALLLLLIWFRRGTTMPWGGLAAIALAFPASPAQAGPKDWFLTPDQQGWILYQRKDFSTAAEAFSTPYLRGIALYKSGQYEEASALLSRIPTADAAFAAGMAHLKSRKYRDGVASFERALEIDPTHVSATNNLPIAQEILEFVEDLRESSDTGEETGIGADDTVFDNNDGRGQDTEIQPPAKEQTTPLTTQQWMNTVDTSTGDFLRQRFQIEAARAAK